MMVSINVTWMWNGSPDPWSEQSVIQWIAYTSIENELIENAFRNQLSKVELKDYEIDFRNKIQINKINRNCQRQIYRNIPREDRFLLEPVIPKSSVQCSYISCYSIFILESQRRKLIKIKQLKTKKTRHCVVEQAAKGIIDEGYIANQVDSAKKMANELLAKKFSSLNEIYACSILLYTNDSFLYGLINTTLRLAEDNLPIEQQNTWTDKLQTLGPYVTILDRALIHYSTRKPMTVYRTAKLNNEQIEEFRKMNFLECGYFSGFTSCSRSLQQAERFNGNVLFTIKLPERHFLKSGRQGLTDVQKFSVFHHEEEVIMRPATFFHVNSVIWNPQTERHDIHLTIL